VISVLGISAFYHDSAAALVQDGKIIAAAQEERFSRKKHDSSYPFHSIEYVLKEASLKLNEIDYIAFYEILSILDIVWLSRSEQEYPRSSKFNFLQDFFA